MSKHIATPEVEAELDALSVEAVQEFMAYSFGVLASGFEELVREFTEQAARTDDEVITELARVHLIAAKLIRERVEKIRAQDPRVIKAGVQATLDEQQDSTSANTPNTTQK